MSLHPASVPATATIVSNPLKAAKTRLVSDFLALFAPAYPMHPAPSDHESVAEHIREALNIFNEYLAAVGSEVRDNAVTAVDVNLFSGTLQAADEIYACEQQAEALREYASERRTSRRA